MSNSYPYRLKSKYGVIPKAASFPLTGLMDVVVGDVSNGDTIQWDENEQIWKNTQTTVSLPSAIQSIADLNTTGNEMLYTSSSNVYEVSPITPSGRSFLSFNSVSAQRTGLGLEIGTDVQEQSSVLDSVSFIGTSVADRTFYTTGTGVTSTELTSFARSNIINAADATALATSLGYIQGSTSNTGRVVRVTGTNTVSETGLSIDASDNLTGLNDVSVGGDISLTGSLDGISATERNQLANIGATTISGTQWGYLGSLDQALSTSSTPTFTGLNANSTVIQAVANPIGSTDAANKGYVDTVASQGAPPLDSAEVATSTVLPDSPAYASPAETLTSTGNPGSLTIDGIAVSTGDRVLVKDQALATQNGVYDVTDDGASPGPNWVLTRSSDFNQTSMPKLGGTSVFIQLNPSSVVNSGSSWSLAATVNDVDPLTDDVDWVQISAQQSFSAGNGINSANLALGTISASITSRLVFTGGAIDLATVDVAYGGTGVTSLTSGNVLVGDGTSAVQTTKAAPSGVFVGTTDTQTLTNKTITNSSNNVISRELFVNSGASSVSTFAASPPSNGQVLTATSGTTATWQTFNSGSFEPDRTVFVFQGASNSSPNWDSLAGAVADANSLTPTVSNPVEIIMFPGTYSEATPVTISPHVSVSCSQRGPVIIRPTAPAPANAVLILGGNSRIAGLVIEGFDGTSGYATIGVQVAGGAVGSLDYAKDVTARNCSTANYLITGNGTQLASRGLIVHQCSSLVTASFPFTCDAGWEVESAGLLSGENLRTSGFLSGGGFMSRGVYCHDDLSYTDINNVQVTSVTDALVVGGGVTSNSQSQYPVLRTNNAQVAFITGTAVDILAKATFYTTALIIDDNTGIFPNQQDLSSTNPALPADPNSITINNGTITSSRVNLQGGATNNLPFYSGLTFNNIVGEREAIFLEDVAVGTPLNAREVAVGTGDATFENMTVLRDDGGVFTDITSSMVIGPKEPLTVDLATTTSINLSSAPATIDGIAPVSGASRILVKDGSTANPGTTSVDNGIYLWNGTGNAMTRTSDFASGEIFEFRTYFRVGSDGALNYDNVYRIDPTSIAGATITIGTTAFSYQSLTQLVFPSTPANNDALYIGNTTNKKLEGVRMTMSSPITLSSGTLSSTIIWEYWNGSAWTEMPIMTTLRSSPYTSFQNSSLGFGDATVGNPDAVTYHVYFRDVDDFSTTSINSTNAYWVRIRLLNATNMNKNPKVEAIRCNYSRTEVNGDGFVQFFGAARPERKVSSISKDWYEVYNGSQYNRLANRNVQIANDGSSLVIDCLVLDSRMENNDSSLSSAQVFTGEIDTSQPVTLTVHFIHQSAAAGNVALQVFYAFMKNGDGAVVNGSGTATNTGFSTALQIKAIPASSVLKDSVSFQLEMTTFDCDNDVLWMSFIRLGSNVNDTFTSDIVPTNFVLSYTAWRGGSHL